MLLTRIIGVIGVLAHVLALPDSGDYFYDEATIEEQNDQDQENSRSFTTVDTENDNSPLDVNRTIEEVERILEANPSLPRLSRTEIIDILENLTSSLEEGDNGNLTDETTGEISRQKHAKALMVVLPYTAGNMSESKIKELYTRPPITRLIDNKTEIVLPSEHYNTGPSKTPSHQTQTLNLIEQTSTHRPSNYHYEQQTSEDSSSALQEISAPSLVPLPQQFNEDYNINNAEITPLATSTLSTKIEETSLKYTQLPQTLGQLSYHRKPEVKQHQKIPERYSVQPPPNKPTKHHHSSIPVRQKIRRPVNHAYRPSHINYNKITQSPDIFQTSTYPTTSNKEIDLGLPHSMKNVLQSFELNDHLTAPPTYSPEKVTLYMTPPENSWNAYTSVTDKMFQASSTQKPPLRENVQNVLASIGLYPDSHKTTPKPRNSLPDVSIAAESLTPEMKDVLVSIGLLPSPDINIKENQAFENSAPQYYPNAPSPSVDPTSYVNFKPLPIGKNIPSSSTDQQLVSSEMREFLASFGLVSDSESGKHSSEYFSHGENIHGYRQQKALPMESVDFNDNQVNHEKMPQINTDILTDDMREVLQALGIMPSSTSKKDPEFSESTDQGVVFNPEQLARQNQSKEDVQKLNKILQSIKQYSEQNSTFVDEQSSSFNFTSYQNENDTENFEDHSVEIPETLNENKDGPNPLSLEELIHLYNEQKNEVKRQNANDTAENQEVTTVSSNDSSTSGSEVTTESRNPSLEALAESFGGGETASSDASIDDALPPAKPNGLYFLLDWNSFLEVGEDESKNKVNIRLTPKAGDPRNFLPVTVP